jgi:hypothetical protein
VSSSEPRDTTYDPIVENFEGYDSQLFPEKARLIEKKYSAYKLLLACHK